MTHHSSKSKQQVPKNSSRKIFATAISKRDLKQLKTFLKQDDDNLNKHISVVDPLSGKVSGTPLHLAVHFGWKEGINHLIKSNANVNAQNRQALTPFELAISKKKVSTSVAILLEAESQKLELSVQEEYYTKLTKLFDESPKTRELDIPAALKRIKRTGAADKQTISVHHPKPDSSGSNTHYSTAKQPGSSSAAQFSFRNSAQIPTQKYPVSQYPKPEPSGSNTHYSTAKQPGSSSAAQFSFRNSAQIPTQKYPVSQYPKPEPSGSSTYYSTAKQTEPGSANQLSSRNFDTIQMQTSTKGNEDTFLKKVTDTIIYAKQEQENDNKHKKASLDSAANKHTVLKDSLQKEVACLCCDTTVFLTDTITCTEYSDHWVCTKCIKAGISAQNKYDYILCLATFAAGFADKACQAPYSQDILFEKATDEMLAFSQKSQKQYTKNSLKSANLDLEECPFCTYQEDMAEAPKESYPNFKCKNPSCEKISCRSCNAEAHPRKTCEEAKAANSPMRARIATAIDNAIAPQCPKCHAHVQKSDQACNKLLCKCGTFLCDCCNKVLDPIRPMSHFPLNPTGDQCHLTHDYRDAQGNSVRSKKIKERVNRSIEAEIATILEERSQKAGSELHKELLAIRQELWDKRDQNVQINYTPRFNL